MWSRLETSRDLFVAETLPGGVYRICFIPWHNQGIVHGFCGVGLRFRSGSWGRVPRQPHWEGMGFDEILLAKQVHGDRCVPYAALAAAEIMEADAVTAAAESPQGTALGVVTADCLAVLARTGGRSGVLHAGWRGLAGWALRSFVESLDPKPEDSVELVIGPCAGPDEYEVGGEVIEALGPCGEAVRHGEKYLLSLPATLATQAKVLADEKGVSIRVVWCGIGTVTNPLFHSYRREGNAGWRNVAYIVPPGSAI